MSLAFRPKPRWSGALMTLLCLSACVAGGAPIQVAQVPVGDGLTVSLAPGSYELVWRQEQHRTGPQSYDFDELSVTSDDGGPIRVRTLLAPELRYEGDEILIPMFSFTIEQPGAYRIDAQLNRRMAALSEGELLVFRDEQR